jgi:hypothetical protein
LYESIKFKVFKGLKLMAPYSGSSVRIKVIPGQEHIILIKSAYSGWDMRSSTKSKFK